MPGSMFDVRPWRTWSSWDGGALSEEPDAVAVVMPPGSSYATSWDSIRR